MTGVAVAAACSSCAPLIGDMPECAPGRHMAVIHDAHVAELVAAGWQVIDYPDQPSDVICSHYRALCAEED